MVRQGLRALLEADPDIDVVGEASDGLTAVEMAERLKPDVLVADVRMPGLSGLDIALVLGKRVPQTRVVVLSMHSDVESVAQAMRNGAAAYVLKDSGYSELSKAVRAAAAGRRYVSAPFAGRSLESWLRPVTDEGLAAFDSLTPREREVLSLESEGLTAAEIGERLAISARTAESHRANVLRKLGLRTKADLIRYVLRRDIDRDAGEAGRGPGEEPEG